MDAAEHSENGSQNLNTHIVVTNCYALWIPRLHPSPIDRPVVRSREIILSDISSLPGCRLRSYVPENSFDIIIRYSLGGSLAEKELRFECVDKNRTGLIVYKLDYSGESDPMIESLDKKMHPSMYHFIKEHFHKHSFHDGECDSLLRPYATGSRIDLQNSKTRKDIYVHYLDQYIDKTKTANINLAAQYSKLVTDINNERHYKSSLDAAYGIKKESERKCGEALYAKALLEMSRVSVSGDLYQRLYDNILELEILDSKCRDAYNIINNGYNNRLARVGIFFGVLGIVLTTVLEIVHVLSTNH